MSYVKAGGGIAIEVSPETLAEVFCEMSVGEKGDFLNAVVEHSRQYIYSENYWFDVGREVGRLDRDYAEDMLKGILGGVEVGSR